MECPNLSDRMTHELIQALAPDARGPGTPTLELQPVRRWHRETNLFRVRCILTGCGESAGAARFAVLKRVSAREYHIHRLLSDELPDTVAPLRSAWPVRDRDGAQDEGWFILMEDLTGEAEGPSSAIPVASPALPISPGNRAELREGLRTLARIHGHFSHRAEELQHWGLTFTPPASETLGASVDPCCTALALYAMILDLPLQEPAIDAIRRIALQTFASLDVLQRPTNITLVHGDFHLANIAPSPAHAVRILDWGSCTLHVPTWDLVMCDEEEIDLYLAARSSSGCQVEDECCFYEQLRAAVICRMYMFMHAMLQAMSNDIAVDTFEAMARCLPICAAQLLYAGACSVYRGGRAFLPSDTLCQVAQAADGIAELLSQGVKDQV